MVAGETSECSGQPRPSHTPGMVAAGGEQSFAAQSESFAAELERVEQERAVLMAQKAALEAHGAEAEDRDARREAPPKERSAQSETRSERLCDGGEAGGTSSSRLSGTRKRLEALQRSYLEAAEDMAREMCLSELAGSAPRQGPEAGEDASAGERFAAEPAQRGDGGTQMLLRDVLRGAVPKSAGGTGSAALPADLVLEKYRDGYQRMLLSTEHRHARDKEAQELAHRLEIERQSRLHEEAVAQLLVSVHGGRSGAAAGNPDGSPGPHATRQNILKLVTASLPQPGSPFSPPPADHSAPEAGDRRGRASSSGRASDTSDAWTVLHRAMQGGGAGADGLKIGGNPLLSAAHTLGEQVDALKNECEALQRQLDRAQDEAENTAAYEMYCQRREHEAAVTKLRQIHQEEAQQAQARLTEMESAQQMKSDELRQILQRSEEQAAKVQGDREELRRSLEAEMRCKMETAVAEAMARGEDIEAEAAKHKRHVAEVMTQMQEEQAQQIGRVESESAKKIQWYETEMAHLLSELHAMHALQESTVSEGSPAVDTSTSTPEERTAPDVTPMPGGPPAAREQGPGWDQPHARRAAGGEPMPPPGAVLEVSQQDLLHHGTSGNSSTHRPRPITSPMDCSITPDFGSSILSLTLSSSTEPSAIIGSGGSAAGMTTEGSRVRWAADDLESPAYSGAPHPAPLIRARSAAGDSSGGQSRPSAREQLKPQPTPRGASRPAAGNPRTRCARCGQNDATSPGRCAFHPFLAGNVGPFLYTPEWHACRNAHHTEEQPGCYVRSEHYYPAHLTGSLGASESHPACSSSAVDLAAARGRTGSEARSTPLMAAAATSSLDSSKWPPGETASGALDVHGNQREKESLPRPRNGLPIPTPVEDGSLSGEGNQDGDTDVLIGAADMFITPQGWLKRVPK
ncbi:hypothetical protein CYMTET_6149 [Cymbomonas tetramitiformis]|uniref:Uncharacterized protein n=1 Tax=Cymbomonas tetramitiformis TaxID=36881 RepID=A0AAE0GY05_9CHLO|nr:hypothetical protein CYMTET_6149 [Cymbomonas tetramitiformis]